MTKTKEGIGKKIFVLSSSLRIPDPISFWEPQTPLSSLGTPDFLSTCLKTDSHTERWTPQVSTCLICYWREGDDRGWDGWMASPTRRTWVWASSRSWWWTGKPGMLQSMGVTKIWTRLSDWTELREYDYSNRKFHAIHTKILKFMNELGKVQG